MIKCLIDPSGENNPKGGQQIITFGKAISDSIRDGDFEADDFVFLDGNSFSVDARPAAENVAPSNHVVNKNRIPPGE